MLPFRTPVAYNAFFESKSSSQWGDWDVEKRQAWCATTKGKSRIPSTLNASLQLINGRLELRIPRHFQALVVMWLTAHKTTWQRGIHCAKEDWDTTESTARFAQFRPYCENYYYFHTKAVENADIAHKKIPPLRKHVYLMIRELR